MTRGAHHFIRSQAVHDAQSMWLPRVTRLEAENKALRALLTAATAQFPHDEGWLHEAQSYLAGDPVPQPTVRA